MRTDMFVFEATVTRKGQKAILHVVTQKIGRVDKLLELQGVKFDNLVKVKRLGFAVME